MEVGVSDPAVSSEKEPMLPQLSPAATEHPTAAHPNILPVLISRPSYNCDTLATIHDLEQPPEESTGTKLKKRLKECCECSGHCILKKVTSFLPFIEMLRTYQWKRWIVSDMIAGLSVGVIHIPQGMGFALLTSLPAIYGLYSSFFPVLIYFFFGTSRHISVGTMALIGLMVGAVIEREVENMGLGPKDEDDPGDVTSNLTHATWTTDSPLNFTNGTSDDLERERERVKVGIAVSITLLVGIFQIIMGVCRLGIIATFMSMPFVASFLTGAAVHIITSQVAPLFGVKLPGHQGTFRVPMVYYELFRHIHHTNVTTLIIGLVCIVLLLIFREVISERFKKKLPVPIPSEFIVIILGTLISHFVNFHGRYNVKIVGTIPLGIPAPSVPPMTNASNYIADAIPIAILSFTISITMAKLLARKHRYPIDVNQELIAYGLMNGGSAFFGCFAGCQAPPRSLVNDATGGKTQMNSIFSCLLVLLVMLALGKLFYSLPNCVLAAIIICALLPLFRQFKELPLLWRANRYDFCVWIMTFLNVVILDITSGLAIGIGLSLVMIVLQAHNARGTDLVNVSQTELYVPSELAGSSKNAVQIPGVKIFRFEAPLFYANVESFKQQLFEKTMNPLAGSFFRVRQVPMKTKRRRSSSFPLLRKSSIFKRHKGEADADEEKENGQATNESQHLESDHQVAVNETQDQVPNVAKTSDSNSLHPDEKKPEASCVSMQEEIKAIVLDCSGMPDIDIMGLSNLKGLYADFEAVGVHFVLAQCTSKVQDRMACYSMPDSLEIFPSIHDAVITCVAAKDKTSANNNM